MDILRHNYTILYTIYSNRKNQKGQGYFHNIYIFKKYFFLLKQLCNSPDYSVSKKTKIKVRSKRSAPRKFSFKSVISEDVSALEYGKNIAFVIVGVIKN